MREHQKNVLGKLNVDRESIQRKKKEHERVINYYDFYKTFLSTDPVESTLWFMNCEERPACLEKNMKSVKPNYCQHLVCESCLLKLLEQNDIARYVNNR